MTSHIPEVGSGSLRLRVVHVITRMILGGAQENTLLTVEDQQHDYGDEVTLVTGPSLGPEGSLMDRAQARGVRVEVIPTLCRSLHPWRDWVSLRAICEVLSRLKPDIVHTHSAKGGVLGRAAAARLRIPCVHSIHGPSFHPWQNWLAWQAFRSAEAWAARRCQRLISVCDAMTEQYVAAGVAPREQFVTIYSGMEVEPFLAPPRPREEVRGELGFASDDIVVGKVARLFHLKGHADVIEAARQAVAVNPRLKFLFVGDGLLRSELERRIEAAGLTGRFVLTGLVPPERVPELIHATDLVVHASLREGLARVLPQALISARPVISYDIDGAREVVIPGETGYLLPPRDVAGLAQAILDLASDPQLRLRMGETGRTRFTDQFRHQTMTRQIRDVYFDVLSQRQRMPERHGPSRGATE